LILILEERARIKIPKRWRAIKIQRIEHDKILACLAAWRLVFSSDNLLKMLSERTPRCLRRAEQAGGKRQTNPSFVA